VAAGSILVATKSYEYGVANPTHDEVQLSMCDIAAQCAHYIVVKELLQSWHSIGYCSSPTT